MQREDLPPDWLDRTLREASEEVASWPEWKKVAYRVIPDPRREQRDAA